MLVLSRKAGQKIRVGNEIVVTVLRLHDGKVRLGIEAPPEVQISRDEIFPSWGNFTDSSRKKTKVV